MREKQPSYDELKCEWDIYSEDDLVMFLSDFNGHIDRHIDGSDGLHRWYGVGQQNLEGRMLLVLSIEGTMCVKYMA